MTSSITARRSLHLVDLENLVGDPRAKGPIVRQTFVDYLHVACWQPGDHVIVASNPWLMAEVVFDLPVCCSAHTAHGHDGADVMLLSLAPPELVATRYSRLVVGSGDGIFAARAEHARSLGVDVLIVAREDGCSYKLRRLDHRFLVDPAVAAAVTDAGAGPGFGLAA